MAIEIRRLIFNQSEAIEAIKAYGTKNGITFPDGKIVRAKFAGAAEYEINILKQIKSEITADHNVKEDSRAVILTIFSEETLEQKYFNLTSNFISAALIEYCIKHKIMLPKDAEKSLDITDFNICLDISRDSFTDEDQSTTRLSLED
ncbi:MAG TPA: hypothetical protein DCM27_07090 [Rhodospirillaceae bacterium]|nr:hypothetical protein [Rhodospirillaceae bacterium]